MVTLHHGDCLDVLKTLPDNSIDSIVTDPPYGLAFMGKRWDYDIPSIDIWRECLRVLKPGGHALIFGGTRTYHRMTCRVEDAGFEIRDCIMWLFGSGFPKSHDVSKAIDREAGAEREIVDTVKKTPSASSGCNEGWQRPWAEGKTTMDITAPATEAAKQWEGWGTALKPAYEPCILARKPLEGTVAANVQKWGVGGLNVDGCRVGARAGNESGWSKTGSKESQNRAMSGANYTREPVDEAGLGRWPANIIHDGSEEVLELFPVTGASKQGGFSGKDPGMWQGKKQHKRGGHDDNGGSAARFFYCAKASKSDRDEGCEGLEERHVATLNDYVKPSEGRTADKNGGLKRNTHPTVKPTDLMRYLCRLITPPHGVILDPFMGSGSTGKAAILEGFHFIGIEREEEYVKTAQARIERAHNQHIAKRSSLSEISDLGCRDDVYKTSPTINVL